MTFRSPLPTQNSSSYPVYFRISISMWALQSSLPCFGLQAIQRIQGSLQCKRLQPKPNPFCLTVYFSIHKFQVVSPPILIHKKHIKTMSKSTDFNFPRPSPYPNHPISQTSLHFHPFTLFFPVFPLPLSHNFS